MSAWGMCAHVCPMGWSQNLVRSPLDSVRYSCSPLTQSPARPAKTDRRLRLLTCAPCMTGLFVRSYCGCPAWLKLTRSAVSSARYRLPLSQKKCWLTASLRMSWLMRLSATTATRGQVLSSATAPSGCCAFRGRLNRSLNSKRW